MVIYSGLDFYRIKPGVSLGGRVSPGAKPVTAGEGSRAAGRQAHSRTKKSRGLRGRRRRSAPAAAAAQDRALKPSKERRAADSKRRLYSAGSWRQFGGDQLRKTGLRWLVEPCLNLDRKETKFSAQIARGHI